MSRTFAAAAMALLAANCATGDLPRAARQFDQAWAATVLGDEFARAGAYHYMTGEWEMVSVIRLPDRSWLVRRTVSTRHGAVYEVARSSTCAGLTGSIEELGQVSPTMRELGLNQGFYVRGSDDADVRLRVHTYFDDDSEAVSLTTIDANGNLDSPIFHWYEGLLRSAETCWTPES